MRNKIVTLLSATLLLSPIKVEPISLQAETTEIVYEGFKEDMRKTKMAYEERLENERLIQEHKSREMKARVVRLNYNPYNLREPSNLTLEKAEEILEPYALKTLARCYIYMEEKYGVNALLLIALNREESANGRSSLAISNNNLGGVKSRNGNYRYYNNWEESLDDIARLLGEEYLSEDGLFFNGYSIWNVNKKYCEQDNWAGKLNNIVYEMMR